MAKATYGSANIKDTNGNELVAFVETTSAVNEVSLTNAATGNGPSLTATGGDTNIALILGGKGTGGVKIGSAGTGVLKFASGTVTIDFGSVSANNTGTQTATITGAATGDVVLLNIPSGLEAGLVLAGCYVSAADTITVRLANVTGSPIDPASASYRYIWYDLT
jgi:hypothetical protein